MKGKAVLTDSGRLTETSEPASELVRKWFRGEEERGEVETGIEIGLV